MNFKYLMNRVITITVVVTTIVSNFLLAYGYLKYEKMKKLGTFVLIMGIIITLAGITNPISMLTGLNVLGLTERLVIYSLLLFMFVLSYYYIFNKEYHIYKYL